MHKDPLQYAFQNRPQPRTEGFSAEGKEFMPLFDAYNIDVVLSAHLHTYRNRGHIRNFQRDRNLDVTGYLNENTLVRLLADSRG